MFCRLYHRLPLVQWFLFNELISFLQSVSFQYVSLFLEKPASRKYLPLGACPPAAPDWSNLIEFTNTKKPPNQNLGSIRFTIPNTFTAHAFNTHHQSSINTPRGKYFREAGFFKNKETYANETDCNDEFWTHSENSSFWPSIWEFVILAFWVWQSRTFEKKYSSLWQVTV